MTYVNVNDVTLTYPNGVCAVRGVSLEIDQGANIAIIGQNGAGKSTLSKLLNGLLKPGQGDIIVEGKNTKEHTTAQIARRVGYVFQNPDEQIFNNSVYDEIAFALKRLNYDETDIENRVKAAASLTGLTEQLEENPYDLPLSIRKLVTIAAVIATDAQVIILDEPTAGQDRHGLDVISRVIHQLNQEGRAVITITHDMEYVVNNFKHVIVMVNGEVKAQGTPAEIFFDQDLMDQAMLNPPTIVQIYQRLMPQTKSVDLTPLLAQVLGQEPAH